MKSVFQCKQDDIDNNQDFQDEKEEEQILKKQKNNQSESKISSLVKVPKVKTYEISQLNQPDFKDFELHDHQILQLTDIKTNMNKYYSLEVHSSVNLYRVFTHYGRTCDLEQNPYAGKRESRYYHTLQISIQSYQEISFEKIKKGYKPVQIQSSSIGSYKLIELGNKKNQIQTKNKPIKKLSNLGLSQSVQKLVIHIYQEATNFLTKVVSAQIKENGIHTPLGKLSLEQIDKGVSALTLILQELKMKNPKKEQLIQYSNDFYTAIPHKLGRLKEYVISSVIENEKIYSEKMELLDLMKDMVKQADSEFGNVLYDKDIDKKYLALDTIIQEVMGKEFQDIVNYIKNNLYFHTKKGLPKIKGIFLIKKIQDLQNFNTKVGNEKLLFHGTKIWNWVSILSKGMLMPDAVTKLGVQRTDFGWLGAGVYFGDVWETAMNYSSVGADKSGYILLSNVAMGKVFEQKHVDGLIKSTPQGFDSIHGNPELNGGFCDHEFCVYRQDQIFQKYLIYYQE